MSFNHHAPTIWTIADGRRGMNAQVLGLAQEIARLSGGPIQPYTVTAPAWANLLPPSLAASWRLFDMSPPPQSPNGRLIAIGCGEKAQTALLALKKRFGAFAVYIQRPRADAKKFDAIVASRHDYAEHEIERIEQTANDNIILTLGAIGSLSPAMLVNRRESARRRFADYAPPFIAVLVGGENRAYRPDSRQLIAQLSAIAEVAKATLLITPSRRSDNDLVAALQNSFADSHFVWRGTGDNPYADIVAAADAFCVTCDSVNMVSEACAAGRAVYLLPLPPKDGYRARRAAGKFARFHAAIADRGHARQWSGKAEEWAFFESPPLNETARAAAAVWSLFSRG